MKIEESKGGDIIIRFDYEKDEEVFMVNGRNGFSIYLKEKTADMLAFHIETILQDRDIRKKKSLDKK